MESLTIEKRFCGPPQSGNGGYTCGMLARLFSGPAEVTLRKPPPLHREMQIQRADDTVKLLDGDTLIAEAKATRLELEPPESVTLETARQAAEEFVGFRKHYFPSCFVCGPERKEGDGLRIFSGPAGDLVAAPWVPDQSLVDEAGNVKPEFIWSALDCPGFFAAFNGRDLQPALLARMAAEIRDSLQANETYIVIGWLEKSDGRKNTAGTAILKQDGSVAAVARELWITVSELEKDKAEM